MGVIHYGRSQDLQRRLFEYLPWVVSVRDPDAIPAVWDKAAFFCPHMPLQIVQAVGRSQRLPTPSFGTEITDYLREKKRRNRPKTRVRPGRFLLTDQRHTPLTMQLKRRFGTPGAGVGLTEMGLWCLENVGEDAAELALQRGNLRAVRYEGEWAAIDRFGERIDFLFRNRTMASAFKLVFG